MGETREGFKIDECSSTPWIDEHFHPYSQQSLGNRRNCSVLKCSQNLWKPPPFLLYPTHDLVFASALTVTKDNTMRHWVLVLNNHVTKATQISFFPYLLARELQRYPRLPINSGLEEWILHGLL